MLLTRVLVGQAFQYHYQLPQTEVTQTEIAIMYFDPKVHNHWLKLYSEI